MKNVKNFRILISIGVLSALVLLFAVVQKQFTDKGGHSSFIARAPRPNIILITMDTTRIDHLSCYGYERETSKHLDELAADGLIFDRAYANSSWTYPSHASLMTGMYPVSHGAFYDLKGSTGVYEYSVNRFSDSNPTLAEILRNHDYTTIGIVGGVWMKQRFGLNKGFEIYEDDVRDIAGVKAKDINEKIIEHINGNTKQPFFLFINYFDPHMPYDPPAPFDTMFSSLTLDETLTTETQASGSQEKLISRDLEIKLAMYDSEIAYMDFYMGKLFDLLKQNNMYDNSWIIVTADHGESFGEHDYEGHGGALYENLIHIPLVMKYPKGWSIDYSLDEKIQLMDIMPTMLSRLDIPVPTTCQGQPIGEVTHPIIAEIYRNNVDITNDEERFNRDLKAIIRDPHKLIWSSNGKNELYDIVTDPLENKNIIYDFQSIADELTSALEEWHQKVPKAKKSSVGDLDQRTVDQLKALGYLN